MRREKKGKSWSTEDVKAGERRVKKQFEITQTETEIEEERTSRDKEKWAKKFSEI